MKDGELPAWNVRPAYRATSPSHYVGIGYGINGLVPLMYEYRSSEFEKIYKDGMWPKSGVESGWNTP